VRMDAQSETDRQTDIINVIVAFRNFANAPEKEMGPPTPDFAIQRTRCNVAVGPTAVAECLQQ
jgi:hypothetical protein